MLNAAKALLLLYVKGAYGSQHNNQPVVQHYIIVPCYDAASWCS